MCKTKPQARLDGKEHSAQNGGFDHSTTLPSPPSANKPVSSIPSSPSATKPVTSAQPAQTVQSPPLSPSACSASGKMNSVGFPRCSGCCHAADYVVHDCYETGGVEPVLRQETGDPQDFKRSMSPCIPGRVDDSYLRKENSLPPDVQLSQKSTPAHMDRGACSLVTSPLHSHAVTSPLHSHAELLDCPGHLNMCQGTCCPGSMTTCPGHENICRRHGITCPVQLETHPGHGQQNIGHGVYARRQVMPEHLPGLIGSICNSPWSIDKDLEEIEETSSRLNDDLEGSIVLSVGPDQTPAVDLRRLPAVDPGKLPAVDPGRIPAVDPSKIQAVDPGRLTAVDTGRLPAAEPAFPPIVDPGEPLAVDSTLSPAANLAQDCAKAMLNEYGDLQEVNGGHTKDSLTGNLQRDTRGQLEGKDSYVIEGGQKKESLPERFQDNIISGGQKNSNSNGGQKKKQTQGNFDSINAIQQTVIFDPNASVDDADETITGSCDVENNTLGIQQDLQIIHTTDTDRNDHEAQVINVDIKTMINDKAVIDDYNIAYIDNDSQPVTPLNQSASSNGGKLNESDQSKSSIGDHLANTNQSGFSNKESRTAVNQPEAILKDDMTAINQSASSISNHVTNPLMTSHESDIRLSSYIEIGVTPTLTPTPTLNGSVLSVEDLFCQSRMDQPLNGGLNLSVEDLFGNSHASEYCAGKEIIQDKSAPELPTITSSTFNGTIIPRSPEPNGESRSTTSTSSTNSDDDTITKTGKCRTFPAYRTRLRDLKFPNSVDIFLPIPTHDLDGLDSGGSTPCKSKFVKRSQSYASLNPKYLLENLLKEKNVS